MRAPRVLDAETPREPSQGAATLRHQKKRRLHEARRIPWAITFVDFQAAFYSVIRQSLVPNPDSDQGFLELLHALGLPPSATQELHTHLLSVDELPSCQAHEHLVRMVQDLFTGTWFRISGATALTLTARGTRPGDPAADILFAFTMSAFPRSLESALAAKGLVQSLPKPPSRPGWVPLLRADGIGSPAWADDVARPHAAPTAA